LNIFVESSARPQPVGHEESKARQCSNRDEAKQGKMLLSGMAQFALSAMKMAVVGRLAGALRGPHGTPACALSAIQRCCYAA
jgi:hypothetical protein